MASPLDVSIGCSATNDGKFVAGVFLNGELMEQFPVVTGDCDAIRDLWKRVRDYFPEEVDIEIDGPCFKCVPEIKK